ncbi:MAG: Rad52/Rad22 family DNA repair protein [Dehalococcoidales bacterium]
MEDTKVAPKQPDTTYMKLIKSFPDEAMTTDNSRGFPLTSIKAQCVVERLNQVFGFDGWELEGEYETTKDGVLFFGKLEVEASGEGRHHHSGIGYSKNKKVEGDAYKSARTDCLSKCASWFGVGNEVFKGNVTPPSSGGSQQQSPKKPAARPKQYENGLTNKHLAELVTQAGAAGFGKEQIVKWVEEQYKLSNPNKMNVEQYNKLIQFIEQQKGMTNKEPDL